MFIGSLNLSEILDASKKTDMLLKDEFSLHALDGDTTFFHHPYELEQRLYAAIIDGDIKRIEAIGLEYTQYPRSILCHDNNIRSLKNNLICSCALITRVAIQAGVNEKYAYFLSDLYINKIESLEKEEPLLNLNAIIILDFAKLIKNSVLKDRDHYSSITRDVISYVNENLYNQLSLSEVAKYVNTNTSYLSRVFSHEVGMSFNHYIHENRIKKAQHLLLFSELSIVEIADKLGYCSQSHFSNTFKKITRYTPKQFKNRHVNQAS